MEVSSELRQQIKEIASRFEIFECVDCAAAIRQFLIENRVEGKQIKLFTGSIRNSCGYIYHEGLKQVISENGRHEAISIEINGEEIVFDNIHVEGVPKQSWLSNFYSRIKALGRDFQVTEISF